MEAVVGGAGEWGTMCQQGIVVCGLVSWIAIYNGSLAAPRPSPQCHPYFSGVLLSLVKVLPAGSQVSIFE